MDKAQLKQRIVGAIVLVALGIIFIPMILHRGDDSTAITGTNIPPKPESMQQLADKPMPEPPAPPQVDRERATLVDEFTPPVEQIDSSVADDSDSQKKPELDKSDGTKTTKPAASVPEKSTPEKKTTATKRAWVVQVASLSERSKALKLRDKLRASGYPAFVESVTSAGKTRYRVRVGPEVQKARAEALKKKIAKQFRIKDALVMSHP